MICELSRIYINDISIRSIDYYILYNIQIYLIMIKVRIHTYFKSKHILS